MATEEPDYESDPEDAPLPSMRRREASDDEGDGGSSDGGLPQARRDPRGGVRYDEESDGQGGAPGYDDEEEYDLEDDEELEEEEEVVEVVVEEKAEEREVEKQVMPAASPAVSASELEGQGVEQVEVEGEAGQQAAAEEEEEKKKENEPYAVPTAGAFYMHDDRFQEDGRGRQRRMPGARKLWETKDDHAWLHDRFEEMNLQDVRNNEGRQMSRGRFRGRGSGRIRGTGRGYGRGYRFQSYYDQSNFGPNNYDRSNYARSSGRGNYARSNDRRNYDQSNYDRSNNQSNYDRRNYDQSNNQNNYDRSNNQSNYERSNNQGNYDRRNYDRSNNQNNYDRSNNQNNYDQSNYDQSNDQSNYDQNNVPKFVRGRGPRRYAPAQKNNELLVTQQKQKQSARPQEMMREMMRKGTAERQPQTSNMQLDPGRQPQTSNVQLDPALPRKHVFSSNLNSASPPFYPSGSSSQDVSSNLKRDASGSTNNTFSSSMHVKDSFPAAQSASFPKGKANDDTVSNDRLYMNTSSVINPQVQSSGSSYLMPTTVHSSYSGISGKGINTSVPPNYQQTQLFNQVSKVTSQINSLVQRRPFQAPLQLGLRSSEEQLGQQPGSENQASPPPQALASDLFEVDESEKGSPLISSKSKTSMVERGKTGNARSEKGNFLYNGAQIIGSAGTMGLQHSDQGFPGTPALLPVVQFGGQNQGGLGVPAVGMALPGYVAQSQLGFGNSEMTWLPMLAGAAGALGASYCSPYIALDSSYYNRSSEQSSSVSSSETSSTRPVTAWKPSQETVNDEFAQRQSKPRRYSEMNFGQ